ncbi:4'-phosphopantetheinyl transferase family protein [Ornithinimicrobium sufpigmenti]|uniref:4'-phosphopantetheinyl transferase family protein n=1 Tax=Ornithinimicrobium sufpigmenti TaxID=2508882 RepID=UPI0015E1A5C2|nr:MULTISPECIES: 4'-phosphopantetheinyl transferase superfamily protein [unclassified Ornithinimicrobium]
MLLGPGEVAVGRLCARCGSHQHGRPWARHTAGEGEDGASREVHVSLSRGGGYVVTAASLRGPLGVDVEVVQDVARAWPEDLVLAPGESAGSARERARCWAAKEAVLKRRGTGLTLPMSTVVLRQQRALVDLPAPDGLVAVLAGPL